MSETVEDSDMDDSDADDMCVDREAGSTRRSAGAGPAATCPLRALGASPARLAVSAGPGVALSTHEPWSACRAFLAMPLPALLSPAPERLRRVIGEGSRARPLLRWACLRPEARPKVSEACRPAPGLAVPVLVVSWLSAGSQDRGAASAAAHDRAGEACSSQGRRRWGVCPGVLVVLAECPFLLSTCHLGASGSRPSFWGRNADSARTARTGAPRWVACRGNRITPERVGTGLAPCAKRSLPVLVTLPNQDRARTTRTDRTALSCRSAVTAPGSQEGGPRAAATANRQGAVSSAQESRQDAQDGKMARRPSEGLIAPRGLPRRLPARRRRPR
jgi:hypothetical protein